MAWRLGDNHHLLSEPREADFHPCQLPAGMGQRHTRSIRFHAELDLDRLPQIAAISGLPGELQAPGRLPGAYRSPLDLFAGSGALKHSSTRPWLDLTDLAVIRCGILRQRPPF